MRETERGMNNRSFISARRDFVGVNGYFIDRCTIRMINVKSLWQLEPVVKLLINVLQSPAAL